MTATAAPTNPPRVVTVRLPDYLVKAAETAAKRDNTSRSKYLSEILSHHIPWSDEELTDIDRYTL